jgi:hypothetical protein
MEMEEVLRSARQKKQYITNGANISINEHAPIANIKRHGAC